MAAIEGGAEAIVLGCTGMFGTDAALAATLRDRTGVFIPVIDPIRATVGAAAIALQMGLRQSGLAYGTRGENSPDLGGGLR